MDRDLRVLERATRASPDDHVAGRALARSFERIGDRRRCFLELCRLARLGDDMARSEIASWVPWPCTDGAGESRCSKGVEPLRERPSCASAMELEPSVIPARRRGSRARPESSRPAGPIAGASPGVVLVRLSGELVALGLQDLEVLWRLRPEIGHRWASLRGEDVIVPVRRGLRLLDLATGAEKGHAELAGDPVSLVAWGDRVLANVWLANDRFEIACIDLGRAPGRQLWSRPAIGSPVFLDERISLVAEAAGGGEENLVALDPETGEIPWRRQRTTSPAGHAVDDKSYVCQTDLSVPKGWTHGTRSLSMTNGTVEWERRDRHGFSFFELALGPKLVLAAKHSTSRRGRGLVALGRDLGSERWASSLGIGAHRIAVAGDVAYVTTQTTCDVRLEAFDEGGSRLFDLCVTPDERNDARIDDPGVDLVPIERGFVVAVPREDGSLGISLWR